MQPLGLTKWPKLIKVWLFLQEPSIEFSRYWKWDFVLTRCGRSLYQNLFVSAGNGYGRHKSIGTFCHKIFGYLWKGQGKSCSIYTRSYIHVLKIIHFYPEQKIENRVSTDEDLKLSDTLLHAWYDGSEEFIVPSPALLGWLRGVLVFFFFTHFKLQFFFNLLFFFVGQEKLN